MSHELLGSVVMERGKENIETEKMILEALSFIKDLRLKDCGWFRLLIDINSSEYWLDYIIFRFRLEK